MINRINIYVFERKRHQVNVVQSLKLRGRGQKVMLATPTFFRGI